jgi:hypothetical protein
VVSQPHVQRISLAAKVVAQELKSAAADETKELGLAPTRKAMEVGERRKQRKAEELNATEAAMRTASSSALISRRSMAPDLTAGSRSEM